MTLAVRSRGSGKAVELRSLELPWHHLTRRGQWRCDGG